MTYKEQHKYLHSAAALQVAHGLSPQPDAGVFSNLSQQPPALLSATMPGSSPSGAPSWPEGRPFPTTNSAVSSDLAMLVSLALQCPGAIAVPLLNTQTPTTSPTLPAPHPHRALPALAAFLSLGAGSTRSGPRVCALLQENTPPFFLQRQRQVPCGSSPTACLYSGRPRSPSPPLLSSPSPVSLCSSFLRPYHALCHVRC